MLAKRIIPCLDVTGGRVVKGVNFVELRDAGDPVEIAARYNEQGADELTFLDITAIQASLYKLMEGKTVVAVAHRLSTIAAMDRLIVMDQGRIVEEGDHASLLAQGGLYARLWSHQSGGFLVEDADEAPSAVATDA